MIFNTIPMKYIKRKDIFSLTVIKCSTISQHCKFNIKMNYSMHPQQSSNFCFKFLIAVVRFIKFSILCSFFVGFLRKFLEKMRKNIRIINMPHTVTCLSNKNNVMDPFLTVKDSEFDTLPSQ